MAAASKRLSFLAAKPPKPIELSNLAVAASEAPATAASKPIEAPSVARVEDNAVEDEDGFFLKVMDGIFRGEKVGNSRPVGEVNGVEGRDPFLKIFLVVAVPLEKVEKEKAGSARSKRMLA
jgi:hypothetical protein